MTYDEIKLQIKKGDTIINWTVLKGVTGVPFNILEINDKYITVTAPNARNEQKIPKKDFEVIISIWKDYCKKKFNGNSLEKKLDSQNI